MLGFYVAAGCLVIVTLLSLFTIYKFLIVMNEKLNLVLQALRTLVDTISYFIDHER